MGKIIGIDLGTTNSCVAVIDAGTPRVLENSEGRSVTPSVVVFKKDGERVVGDTAKRQIVTNHDRAVYSIKRFMGRLYKEVSHEKEEVPFKVIQGPNSDVRVRVADRDYSPPEIGAMVLQKMKQTAEEK
ncbi:MAG: Hsp70 family protein, partial [Candidatus Marinimicrobia bacterium]|nr:Hsp70 family protein [Candidatus Neomarinimicrobiota bacterium]